MVEENNDKHSIVNLTLPWEMMYRGRNLHFNQLSDNHLICKLHQFPK